MNIVSSIAKSSRLKIASYAIIFIMYGFDVRTYLGGIMPINLITSIIIILIVPIFFLLVVNARRWNKNIQVHYVDSLLLVFFMMYGLRLFVNLYIEGIEQTIFNNNFTCFIYLLFLCILPYVIFRNIDWKSVDMLFVLKTLIFLYFLGLILSFKTILTNLASGVIYYDGRADANTFLDTIGYGHLALSFMLACYAYHSKKRMNYWIFLFSIIFCLISMGLANSRSPFLALLLVIGIIFLEHIRIWHIFFFFLVGLLVYFNLGAIDTFFQENFNSTVIERLLMVSEVGVEDASNGRDSLFKGGLLQFEQAPILGSSLVLTSGAFKGAYVHNSIIEVLMGLGIVGFLFYVVLNFIIMKEALYLIRKNSRFSFFAFIFIQYSVFLLFSRSLLLLPLYWSSIACVYTCSKVEKSKLVPHENSNNNSCICSNIYS